MKWQTIAEKLWKLLDDIDTLSDVHKPEQTEFYKAVMAKVNKRHTLLSCFDGQSLTRPHESVTPIRTKHLFLYLVRLRGMTVTYGTSYIIAENLSEAHDIIKKFCDDNDLGFKSERALESIEVIAETNMNGDVKRLFHITPSLVEKEGE